MPYKLQQLQQSLIPLCEVGYMNHTTPFDTVKKQSFKNIIKSKISLDYFLQHPFQSPSSPFLQAKNLTVYSSNWRLLWPSPKPPFLI